MKPISGLNRTNLFFLFLIYLSFVNSHLFSQSVKGFSVAEQNNVTGAKRTFAIICGISNYSFIPRLSYAAEDARLFSGFLRSPAGGNVPDDNIRLLTDQQVTAPNILVKSMGWLNAKSLQKGDRVYIYFSGHGDAVSPEESYLLMCDADPAGDKNNYAISGTIQLFNLKNRIRNLTEKGIEVILIIDACRTNELPGGQEGLNRTAESMMEKKAGELMFLAASPNEYSLEDKRWGNGHGVFTWYLIDGLTGQADDDANGKITADEIQSFVIENVKRETRALGKMQTPYYCCNTFHQEVLAFATKKGTPAEASSGIPNDHFSSTVLRGIAEKGYPDTDSNALRNYQLMLEAIEEKRFLGTEPDNADHYYRLIAGSGTSGSFERIARYDLATALIDKSQEAVNRVFGNFKSGESYPSRYFQKHAAMLNRAIELIGNEIPDYQKELEARLFYLNACAFHDYHPNFNGKIPAFIIKEGLMIRYDEFADSIIAVLRKSLALGYNKANVFFEMSDIYCRSRQPDSSIHYAAIANRLAPSWIRPYLVTISSLMMKDTVNFPDSVFNAMEASLPPTSESAFQIVLGIHNAWRNYGLDPGVMHDKEKKYLEICLKRDSLNKNALVYIIDKVSASAKAFRDPEPGMRFAPGFRLPTCDSVSYWVSRLRRTGTFSHDSKCIECYFEDGDFENVKRVAAEYLNDPQGTSTYTLHDHSNILLQLYNSEALTGNIYPPDSFLARFHVTEENTAVQFYLKLAGQLKKDNKLDSAIGLYEKVISMRENKLPDEKMDDSFHGKNIYYSAAACYALLGNKSRSLDYLEKSLKNNKNLNYVTLRNDNDFDLIRKDPQFRKLMKKYFSGQY